MDNVTIKELDYKTLKFCHELAWQFGFVTGRNNADNRAKRRAYATMQDTILAYMQKVSEGEGSKDCIPPI